MVCSLEGVNDYFPCLNITNEKACWNSTKNSFSASILHPSFSFLYFFHTFISFVYFSVKEVKLFFILQMVLFHTHNWQLCKYTKTSTAWEYTNGYILWNKHLHARTYFLWNCIDHSEIINTLKRNLYKSSLSYIISRNHN